MEAVNDYRIDFATKQLVNTHKTISEIGFDSGFNDISNFYKTFKRKVKYSPMVYGICFFKMNKSGMPKLPWRNDAVKLSIKQLLPIVATRRIRS